MLPPLKMGGEAAGIEFIGQSFSDMAYIRLDSASVSYSAGRRVGFQEWKRLDKAGIGLAAVTDCPNEPVLAPYVIRDTPEVQILRHLQKMVEWGLLTKIIDHNPGVGYVTSNNPYKLIRPEIDDIMDGRFDEHWQQFYPRLRG